jgi:ankyrin repeat protein
MSDQVTRGAAPVGGRSAGRRLSGIVATLLLAVAMLALTPPGAFAGDDIFPGQNVKLANDDLVVAARDGDVDGVRDALMRGIPPDDGGIGNVPALIVATENNHGDVVRYLLDHGANPNRKAPDDGRTALSVAAQAGRINLVSMLLAAKADPNLVADHGDTPLFIAVRARRTAVVQMLLGYNVDLEDTDITGRTALELAEERHYDEIARILQNAGT